MSDVIFQISFPFFSRFDIILGFYFVWEFYRVSQKACRKASFSKLYPKRFSFEKDVDLGFLVLVHGYILDL